MVWKGCERSVITYSSLISACEKAGQWELALELFNEMHSEGCSPNTVTFNSLITACAQGERVAAAWCTGSSACAGPVARLCSASLCQAACALPITLADSCRHSHRRARCWLGAKTWQHVSECRQASRILTLSGYACPHCAHPTWAA